MNEELFDELMKQFDLAIKANSEGDSKEALEHIANIKMLAKTFRLDVKE